MSPEPGPRDSAPPDIRSTGSPDSETLDSHDLDVTMADSTFTFGNTMHMDDLGGGDVTPPPCAASVPLPAQLAQAIEEEMKASSGNTTEPEMGDYRLVTRPIDTCEDPGTQLAILSLMDLNRPQDPHDQTLRATRVRKVPDSASAAVSAAAVPERTNRLAANIAVIRKWSTSAKFPPRCLLQC